MSATPLEPIRYRIVPKSPEAHCFEVSCTVMDPDPEGQCFALPAWIPGSYLVRDFARHIVTIRAYGGVGARNGGAAGQGVSVPLTKLDKHTWRAEPMATKGPLTVVCEIFAWDLSVRGAHLDTTHAFFNGTSVFLRALGREARRCEVDIVRPAGRAYAQWEVATALPRAGAPAWGFGRYAAADYDELIDHPVEMGTFTRARFLARGIPHDVAITGRHRADVQRLVRDMRRICETQIDFWHGRGASSSQSARRAGSYGAPGTVPFKRFLFLVTALGEGYGGLEHRASTALVCARNDLPQRGMKPSTADTPEGYRTFLGLVSHEYFHTWNVKRIKPAAFTPYDLDRENYTELLWAFEGLTSYYDDLLLLRAGLITRTQYLELLGRNITQLLRTPGRRKQSVTDSSFDAWTKYYRQDENSPNAIVSYYGKGSLIGLCLDLTLRAKTGGRRSLDDVMRALWKRHGAGSEGVSEGGIEQMVHSVSGLNLRREFKTWLHTTAELPLKEVLDTHGVAWEQRPADSATDKGGRKSTQAAVTLRLRPVLGVRGSVAASEYRISHVLDGGAAQAAGLSAGDVVVAVDGLRVGAGGVDGLLSARRPGERVILHAFRRDELMTFDVRLKAPDADTVSLFVDDTGAAMARGAKRRLREGWLHAIQLSAVTRSARP